MYDQLVESCDCVDEETECSDARVQGRSGYSRRWVLPVMRVNSRSCVKSANRTCVISPVLSYAQRGVRHVSK